MPITLLEQITDPGAPDRANEDAAGAGPSGAVVLDGATGLAEAPLLPGEASDAAWIAQLGVAQILPRLSDPTPLAAIVADAACVARDGLAAAGVDLAAHPRWAAPTAGLQILRETATGLETAGLGDCGLWILDADGALTEHSGQQSARDAEQARAREAIAVSGGLTAASGALRAPEVVARLRAERAARNQPGADWSFGADPAAAENLLTAAPAPARPALALLATDGFLDLVALYRVMDAATLIRRAAADGLAPLLKEIRRLEREVDPEGFRYPRFKRSDDATALLLSIT